MRIRYKTHEVPIALPDLRAGWHWPPRDLLDERIGAVVFGTGPYTLSDAEREMLLDRRVWPESAGASASSTITVGSQVHDELAGVTPLTPEQEAAIERVLGERDRVIAEVVAGLGVIGPAEREAEKQAAREADWADRWTAACGEFHRRRRMAQLSDKTMREIRERSDRIIAEREAAAERAARKVERWAEVALVTLLAIGFLIWAW